jgi:hypothetical protein
MGSSLIERTIEATFRDLINRKVLWGIEPIFDGSIDLKIKDPIMKMLFLVYMQYDSAVYPSPLRQTYLAESYPAYDLRGDYPIQFPFLGKTFMEHWEDSEDLLKAPIWVKFINLEEIFPRYYYYQPRLGEIEGKIKKKKDSIRRTLEKEGFTPSTILLVDYYGNIEENIGEFIALLFFRGRGYLTMNFGPYTGVRSPDVTCWKTYSLKKLVEHGFVEYGSTLYELQMLRILRKIQSNKIEEGKGESVVIEVESAKSRWGSGIMQLLGNRYTGAEGYVEGYDEGYLLCPFSCNPDERIGIISFDENGLFFYECPRSWAVEEKKKLRMKEIDDLVKMSLLTNLTLDETFRLIPDRPKTYFQLLSRLTNIDIDIILDKIEKAV